MKPRMMLPTNDAARKVGVTAATLRLWRHLGKGPQYIKLGDSQQAKVVYPEDVLDAWCENHTYRSTSDFTVRTQNNRLHDGSSGFASV